MLDRLEDLLATLAELTARVKGLEARLAALEAPPPSPIGNREVVLGGERIALRPLSPVDWITALNDLPVLLWTYLSRPESELTPEDLEKSVAVAKRHLAAALPEEKRELLDQASVPEISSAFRKLLEVNGLDQALVHFFRKEELRPES